MDTVYRILSAPKLGVEGMSSFISESPAFAAGASVAECAVESVTEAFITLSKATQNAGEARFLNSASCYLKSLFKNEKSARANENPSEEITGATTSESAEGAKTCEQHCASTGSPELENLEISRGVQETPEDSAKGAIASENSVTSALQQQKGGEDAQQPPTAPLRAAVSRRACSDIPFIEAIHWARNASRPIFPEEHARRRPQKGSLQDTVGCRTERLSRQPAPPVVFLKEPLLLRSRIREVEERSIEFVGREDSLRRYRPQSSSTCPSWPKLQEGWFPRRNVGEEGAEWCSIGSRIEDVALQEDKNGDDGMMGSFLERLASAQTLVAAGNQRETEQQSLSPVWSASFTSSVSAKGTSIMSPDLNDGECAAEDVEKMPEGREQLSETLQEASGVFSVTPRRHNATNLSPEVANEDSGSEASWHIPSTVVSESVFDPTPSSQHSCSPSPNRSRSHSVSEEGDDGNSGANTERGQLGDFWVRSNVTNCEDRCDLSKFWILLEHHSKMRDLANFTFHIPSRAKQFVQCMFARLKIPLKMEDPEAGNEGHQRAALFAAMSKGFKCLIGTKGTYLAVRLCVSTVAELSAEGSIMTVCASVLSSPFVLGVVVAAGFVWAIVAAARTYKEVLAGNQVSDEDLPFVSKVVEQWFSEDSDMEKVDDTVTDPCPGERNDACPDVDDAGRLAYRNSLVNGYFNAVLQTSAPEDGGDSLYRLEWCEGVPLEHV